MLCLLLLLLSEAEQKLSRREQAEHAPFRLPPSGSGELWQLLALGLTKPWVATQPKSDEVALVFAFGEPNWWAPTGPPSVRLRRTKLVGPYGAP